MESIWEKYYWLFLPNGIIIATIESDQILLETEYNSTINVGWSSLCRNLPKKSKNPSAGLRINSKKATTEEGWFPLLLLLLLRNWLQFETNLAELDRPLGMKSFPLWEIFFVGARNKHPRFRFMATHNTTAKEKKKEDFLPFLHHENLEGILVIETPLVAFFFQVFYFGVFFFLCFFLCLASWPLWSAVAFWQKKREDYGNGQSNGNHDKLQYTKRNLWNLLHSFPFLNFYILTAKKVMELSFHKLCWTQKSRFSASLDLIFRKMKYEILLLQHWHHPNIVKVCPSSFILEEDFKLFSRVLSYRYSWLFWLCWNLN